MGCLGIWPDTAEIKRRLGEGMQEALKDQGDQ